MLTDLLNWPYLPDCLVTTEVPESSLPDHCFTRASRSPLQAFPPSSRARPGQRRCKGKAPANPATPQDLADLAKLAPPA
jgi:hypothetical protein